jgi:nitrate reductase gamma subunit
MESLLEFAKGPLFRFSFAIMILGLLRLLILAIINAYQIKNKAKDKVIPKKYVRKLTFGYLFPIRAFRVKPFYALVSIIFHIGLIFTPLLLFDHALLFDNAIGISWIGITLSKQIADVLTIVTIVTGIILLILRISNKQSRFISRKQDFLWPLILIIPSFSGLICAQLVVSPDAYNFFMLIHILSGCLIFILMPFSKIAHCVLMPLSQWITARVWKFPPEAGEEVLINLGKEGEKL